MTYLKETTFNCFFLFAISFLGCTVPVEQIATNDETNPTSQAVQCVAHEDCESRVCEDNGECLDNSLIIYVDNNGTDESSCGTKANPCSSIQDAVDQVHDGLSTISIAEGNYSQQFGIINQSIRIVGYNKPIITPARGRFCKNVGRCLIESRDTTELTIENIEFDLAGQVFGIRTFGDTESQLNIHDCIFTQTPNMTVISETILNSQIGTKITNSKFVNARVSFFSPNIENPFEIEIGRTTFNNSSVFFSDTKIELTNSIFIDSSISVSLNQNDDGTTVYDYDEGDIRLEFLTYTLTDQSSTDDKITCSPQFDIRQSIAIGKPESRNVIESECSFKNSLIPSTLTGINNFFEEPDFINESTGDLRLKESSKAIDRLRGVFVNDVDFDGEQRPSGEGYDIGADEFLF